MYVCICHGVTDKQIETAVEAGATTMKKLSVELKVGSQCGKCCQCAKKVLNNKLILIAEQLPCVA
ncbi:MAG: (2Fe-2S)-binding protein [Colwellia sp.]|nr:(2Fe-2S)-binding protein [Colwellia sp.]